MVSKMENAFVCRVQKSRGRGLKHNDDYQLFSGRPRASTSPRRGSGQRTQSMDDQALAAIMKSGKRSTSAVADYDSILWGQNRNHKKGKGS